MLSKLNIVDSAGICSAIGLAAIPVFLSLAPLVRTGEVDALIKTDSASSTAYLAPVLSLSASDAEANITPTPTGTFGSASTLINISTNNETGYTLSMSSDDPADMTHKNGEGTIIGTITNLSSATTGSGFSANTYGYNLNDGATASSIFNPVPTASTNIYSTSNSDKTTDLPVNYGIKVDSSIPGGTYSNKITFTATTNKVPATFKNLPHVTISYMQDMTSDICASVSTPEAFKEDGSVNTDVPEIVLEDKRDGNSYTVRKLADGNCWMTSDLKLNAEDMQAKSGTTTLTSSDSDLPEGTTFTVPASVEKGNYSGNAPGVGSGGANGIYLYNWGAARAISSGTYFQNGPTVFPEQSICPKGWQLPNAYGDTKSYYNRKRKIKPRVPRSYFL